MPVDRIHGAGGFGAAVAPSGPKSTDKGFRALLADEAKAEATPARTTEAPAKAAAKPAIKGEKTDAVEGHRYAEIIAGPRNGMFLNTSGNARDGQVFTLVERAGFHFHVYGTGEDRKVFRVRGDDDAPTGGAKPAAPAAPAAPVPAPAPAPKPA